MGIPHLSWPLTLNSNGSFAALEQDSVEELAQCVAVLIVTPAGSRMEAPDYGSPRPEFGAVDAAATYAAVLEWEPRVDLTLDVVAGLGQLGEVTHVKAAVTPHI